MAAEVPHAVYGAQAYPQTRRVLIIVAHLLRLGLRHYLVLSRRYAVSLEEITEDTLECNYYKRPGQMSGAPIQRMAESILEAVRSLWAEGGL